LVVVEDDFQWPTIDVLVAVSMRRYREANAEQLRAEDVARMMRQRGVPWTRNTVTAIERGKRKVSMGELMAFVSTLEMSAHDFFHDDRISMVRLAGDVHMSLGTFIGLLEPLRDEYLRQDMDFMSANALPAERQIDKSELIRSMLDSGDRFELLVDELSDVQKFVLGTLVTDAERRAAKRFGVTPEIVLLASHALWGEGLERVRDRDGSAGNAHKGHRTRDLYDELREVINQRL